MLLSERMLCLEYFLELMMFLQRTGSLFWPKLFCLPNDDESS